MSEINIRRAAEKDVDDLRFLYRDTVIHINSADYSAEEIKAWSDNFKNTEGLKRKITEQYFIVAEIDKVITGFSSIANDGYLDFMYVHKDYQRKGVAMALLKEIESQAKISDIKKIYSHVSKTARPFFEKYGYIKKGKKINKVNNIEFVNSVMVKVL
ncbi:MAG: GNAT family N-acetyltransferase [Ignavibacteria bacterium]